MVKTKCQTPKSNPTYDYPQLILAVEAQAKIFWLPTEPKVEKDLHCIKTELTPQQLHGVVSTLKLFTLYEQVVGANYWGGRFLEMFPRPDFLRLGTKFADVEINTHSPFYQRIDELLGNNTDDFYDSFQLDPVLKSRMDFLDEVIADEDDLLSIGLFSLVEGVILYTNFAFLMSFQANGTNLLANMQSGLTFSVKDENLHSETGAWVFKTLLSEKIEAELITDVEIDKLYTKIAESAHVAYLHEVAIIKQIFELGEMPNIKEEDLVTFCKHRVNLCLGQLGIANLFPQVQSPVEDWFYKAIGGDIQHDFFAKLGSSYNRDWSKSGFAWITTKE